MCDTRTFDLWDRYLGNWGGAGNQESLWLFPAPSLFYIMGNPDGFPFLQNFPSSFLWQRAFLVSLCFLWCFALTFLVNKSAIRSFLFFPLHFSCFSICLGRKIGKFRSMVNALESLVEFRRLYEIPNNVGVSYCPESKVGFRRGEGRVIIPLVAFAGRVRIPMSDLSRNFEAF